MVLAVRQIVERELIPAAGDVDRADRFPADLLPRLAELGLLGAAIPADHGGLGLDRVTGALIVEEIARGSASVAAILASHLALTRLVVEAGTDEQRKRLLPDLATGARLGALALPAPGAGGRPVGRREAAALVLSGRDISAPAATHARDIAVMALISGRPRAVRLSPGDPGLVASPAVAAIGLRGTDTRALTLADCRVPAERLLGRPGDSAEAALAHTLAQWRTHTASAAVGLAQAALEGAVRYSQQRVAFGVPICQHQAIQLKLADMATRITVARLLARHAAQTAGTEAATAAIQAERHAARVAHEVTLEAMRIHGGYGYTTEFPVERYYRDAAPLLARVEADTTAALAVAHRLLGAGAP
jgi:alkylation response protein AidB-like acyl-CoA dehydrogenase